MHARLFVGAFVLVSFALVGGALAAATPGVYSGTTSEKGTVGFTVAGSGKVVKSFTSTDGYSGVCKFKGGVGGIPTFTVKVASMSVAASGAFGSTVKVKVGPFSATLSISGKLAGTAARGTIKKVGPGATCGAGSPTPSKNTYLETFTAHRG